MGSYEVVKTLGRGGMGVVVQAIQKELNRSVALKFIHSDVFQSEELVARFKREVDACTKLSHPNIVKILDCGEQEGKHFLVMELIEDGKTLDRVVNAAGPLPVARVAHLMDQLLAALAYCHEKGFIHRDVKPSNIMVRGDDHLVLMDFGLVKPLGRTVITQQDKALGSPHYMPPELMRAKPATYASDIFSAGVVFYEMLAAAHAFSGEGLSDVMRKILKEDPPSLLDLRPDLPASTDDVMRRFLDKDPGKRVESGAPARRLVQIWAQTPAGDPTRSRRIARATGAHAPVAASPRGISWAGTAGIAVAAIVLSMGALAALRTARTPGSGVESPAAGGTPRPKIAWHAQGARLEWDSAEPYAASLEMTTSSAGASSRTTGETHAVTHHALSVAGLSPGTTYLIHARRGDRPVFEDAGQTLTIAQEAAGLARALNELDAWGLLRSLRSQESAERSRRPARTREERSADILRWGQHVEARYMKSSVASLAQAFDTVKDTYFGAPEVELPPKRDLYRQLMVLKELETAATLLHCPVPALADGCLSSMYGPAQGKAFDATQEVALELKAGAYPIPGVTRGRGPLLSDHEYDADYFLTYESPRERPFDPMGPSPMADAMDRLGGRGFLEVPLDLPLPAPSTMTRVQIVARVLELAPTVPIRLFIRRKSDPAWTHLADLWSRGGAEQDVWHGLDPRSLVEGPARLRIERLWNPEEPTQGNQQSYLLALAIRWR